MKKQLIIASTIVPLLISSFGQGYAAPISSETTGSLSTIQTVTSTTLPWFSSFIGTSTAATSLTVDATSDITFNPSGDIRVTLPAWTIVTPASATDFDTTVLTASSVTVTSGLGTGEVSKGAVEFGTSGVGLHFSKPIRIDIPVSGVSASTIGVKVKHSGSSVFDTTGLTNDASTTCTAGVPSSASSTASVSAGVATIYSCAASTFVAYGPAVAVSSTTVGAGGAGAGNANYPIVGELGSSLNPDLSGILLNSATANYLNVDDLLFADIEGNWAKVYIQKLAIRGVINNSVSYRPEGNLTRAEFIKMTIKASGISVEEGMVPSFQDVPTSHSLHSYIATAAAKGVINANAEYFRPDASITRAEAMKILVNMLGETVVAVEMTSFDDVDSANDLSKYIETAHELGIISGESVDGKTLFRPYDSITRAEIAKVIANAYKL